MLRSLRWQLTFLYLLAAVGLTALVGAGTFILINRYFQQTTDLALQFTLAGEFEKMGLPLPVELARSEILWLQNNSAGIRTNAPIEVGIASSQSDDDEESGEGHDSEESDADGSGLENHETVEHRYDTDLAAIFVILLDEGGNPIADPSAAPPPAFEASTAHMDAIASGSDLRTVIVPDRGRVRLLTYRTGIPSPAFFQAGRLLTDQDRVLSQYLLSIAILGGGASAVLALVSWWLAGRSLHPVQKAWDQQQTFVSNASHELRTPLTLIRASADYSLRNQPAAPQAKLLSDILSECDYMDRLVDDLLLLSRLDAHRLKLVPEPIALAELFAETSQQMNKIAQSTGVTITQEQVKASVIADRTRLRQVLLILLDNALRFTASGGSIVLAAIPGARQVRIEVRDNGKGIPPEHLPHLFDRFYQVRTQEDDSSRSNGLGLAIARSLIEAQGGTIQITSQPGNGTCVTLTLPAAGSVPG